MTIETNRRARAAGLQARGNVLLPLIMAGLLFIAAIPHHHASAADPPIEALVEKVIPDTEAYVANGMKTFDLPGLAIGIVANDRLVYSKGFGVRSRAGGEPVDTRTVFQIGSATKGFLSATMALMVDRGKFHWDDRVVDLEPVFQLKDPWVTREFRMFDLLAQRSGLPPYANDTLGIFGIDRSGLIQSLRHVEPVSSFRSTFAYTNITHILAGQIVAKVDGAQDWNAVLQKEILDPLGMKETSYTAAAIEAAPNHASGYRWVPEGTNEVPFTQIFPYDFDGAGDINSTVEDGSRWLRLQLGNGTFEGRRIISPENLTVTHTPKVAISDKLSYAMGWVIQQTPNGTIVWHNGGTTSFGSYFGMVPERNVGVVVLTNEMNVGFPDAIGRWVLDRILGNPKVDHVADVFKSAKGASERSAKLFAKPDNPRPFPPLTPLAGTFVNPSFGKATLALEGDTLIMSLQAGGAKLRLDPWDGGIFTANLMPLGRFAAIPEDLGPLPGAFIEYRMDKSAALNVLHLSFDDGQSYDFARE
jgi:CubicO group peptidase (beta-lactamase class C family)